MALCKNCGKQYLKDKEKFCSFCGKPLEERTFSQGDISVKTSKRFFLLIVLVLIIAGTTAAIYWTGTWPAKDTVADENRLQEATTWEKETIIEAEEPDENLKDLEVVGEIEKPERIEIYVPEDYPNIQGAIDTSQSGDVIIVKPGTYLENIDFQGKDIILRSTDPEDPETVAVTVIDGGGRGSTVTFQSGESGKAVLEGFTITGGSGTWDEYIIERSGEEQKYRRYYGGGILIKDGSSPTITQNNIRGNQVQKKADDTLGVGGGIAVINSSSPVIRGNSINDNRADGYGGGIIVWLGSAPLLENNEIRNNYANKVGAGIFLAIESDSLISGNSISENRAGESAGGVYIAHGSSAEIVNNAITNNVSEWGGGIMVLKAEALLKDNQIENNRANKEGGGVYLHEDSIVRFSQNLIRNNYAGSFGGGIWVSKTAELAVLVENTYRDNKPQSVYYQP